MEDISLPSDIIQKLDKMHRNMVADGSWNNTNKKDTKIVALNSMVNNMKTKCGMLMKKVLFKGNPLQAWLSDKDGRWFPQRWEEADQDSLPRVAGDQER